MTNKTTTTTNVSEKTIDGCEVWKQFEDLLIPQLELTVIERAVYSHLLRHSRLEGKQQLRFSILWCARGAGLSTTSVRKGVRRLVAKGVLRLAERTKRGHLIEVRLPEEVPAIRAGKGGAKKEGAADAATEINLEELDFLATAPLREAIYERENGRCFYCRRRVTTATRCIDHVIPQVRMGENVFRNLVCSCAECNAQKRDQPAEDFLRWLYREGRLESTELKERLRTLGRLAAGKLRPTVNGASRTGEAARPERKEHGW